MPDKDDLTHAYAAAYNENSDLLLYFGADRISNVGDAFMGFWFFKQKVTALPNGKDYGFIVNNQRIMANRAFIEQNPAAAKLFSVMKLPIAAINAQNTAMNDGANKQADIDKHVAGWIKAHQRLFDRWVDEARAAGKR